MEDSHSTGVTPVAKRVVLYIVAVVVAGAGIGYAVHEHNSAQALAAIEDTRNNLANTSTELTGIDCAHTHDELVVLEKKGERAQLR